VTDPLPSLHHITMQGVVSASSTDGPRAPPAVDVPPFGTVYDTYFPYVWRSVQRLGVPSSQVDDVVQEVFMVVHRRMGDFEARSSLKTWIYGITLRVARVHRAKYRRAQGEAMDLEQAPAPEASRPDKQAANAESVQLVQAILEGLDEDQREVFVLAELEELFAPEIARALGVKLNTVYSRLRLARVAFAEGAARQRARDGWRTR
jgi:RNA polymerase sigma-70 factor (ECF subfamily)